MQCRGKLYGKVAGEYIPLEETGADVDALRARLEKAEADSVSIDQFDRLNQDRIHLSLALIRMAKWRDLCLDRIAALRKEIARKDDALEEARLCISTQDDIERDLGGNDKEMRDEFNRVIDLIDAALASTRPAPAQEQGAALVRIISAELHRLPKNNKGHEIGMMEVGYDSNGQLNYGPLWLSVDETDAILLGIYRALLATKPAEEVDRSRDQFQETPRVGKPAPERGPEVEDGGDLVAVSTDPDRPANKWSIMRRRDIQRYNGQHIVVLMRRAKVEARVEGKKS